MSRKKHLNRKDAQIHELSTMLNNEVKARHEGPIQKRWTSHDLVSLKALSAGQEQMIRSFFQGCHLCVFGSAGTGKTLIAMYLALESVFDKNTTFQQVKIVRSAVPTRNQGFLPGTEEEKQKVYEAPYIDVCRFLTNKATSYEHMKESGYIEFDTTSHIRGVTWDNTVIIVDEAQNMNYHELNSIMTRVGENSRIILVGDYAQTDLNKYGADVSGFKDLINITMRMDEFDHVQFTVDDIVRSKFVKSWIIAKEDYDSKHRK